MDFSIENGVLTIFLKDRVDSVNAAATEAELNAIRAEHPSDGVILDAEEMKYISSAGLRVVLRLRREVPELKIVNASSEVYDIFDMTGFTEMIPVEKAYRRFSVEGCEVIGKGAKGTVYRLNPDTIIKVYNNPDSLPDIHRERELARRAFVLGIPTAIPYDVVRVGESYGSVFELLNARSFSQLMAEEPGNLDKYIRLYAELLRQIHGTTVKREDMPDVKILINKWLREISGIVGEETVNRLQALVDAVPDTLNMLHGDYHTNNIMMQNGETLLIDMDTLAHGHPVFELANVHITYAGFTEVDPENVEDFLGLPAETAKLVWQKFLPLYLGTDDEKTLSGVADKVMLLSYVRLLRHTLRRGGMDTDKGRSTIHYCRDRIASLLEKVDSLAF